MGRAMKSEKKTEEKMGADFDFLVYCRGEVISFVNPCGRCF